MFTVEVIDHSHLEVWIEEVDRNLVELLPKIGEYMLDSVSANFRDEGRPERWAERVPPTGAWPLLFKTGKLYHSLHSIVGTEEVSVTHETEYGDYLDTGTSKMVARPFLLFQNEDVDHIENMIAQAIGE